MKEKLYKLLLNAKTDYYHFPVAAIVECKDGVTFNGVNVETSSPGAGSCAERVALYSALASGYNKGDFKAIYIMNNTDNCIYPCFICRQALLDYCDLDTKIITYNKSGDEKIVLLGELCPLAFSEDDIL